MRVSLDEALSFAMAHCASHLPSPVLRSGGPSSDPSTLRHSLQAPPLFDAAGQSSRLRSAQQKLLSKRSATQSIEEGNKAPLVRLEKRRRVRKKKPVGPPPTAGKDWFDIPNTTLTPELEKTFKVLELRPYMYKDRHYKRSSGVKSAEIPEFFGVGTVLDDPLDFYSTRVQKKKRKQTLAEEILDDEQVRGFVARKAGALKEKEDQLQLIRKRKNGAKKRPKIQFSAFRKGQKKAK